MVLITTSELKVDSFQALADLAAGEGQSDVEKWKRLVPTILLDPTCASTGAGEGTGVAIMITSIRYGISMKRPGRIGDYFEGLVEKEVFHAIGNA